ncbi:prefoldin subunit 1 [Leptinotarsa decemlineata]|uniref:prefoldin subunit 1 n=1 Tax=Leptinotarsa decemlineata TaxID=7539 RepID=UPI000C2535EA|nr:prefoldin subunit 1 [Leptinotarsa decemlineata]
MSKVDMELKKAFAELQEKQLETTQKLRMADIQIENLKRSKQHASITEREINAIEEGTNTYESVGRMFFLTPIEKVKENLKTKQNVAEDKIKVLESNKTFLENSLKEATDSLRELVQSKK